VTDDRRSGPGRRRADRHVGLFILIGVLVVATALGFWLTGRAISDANDAKDRVAVEALARQADTCASQVRGREALRGIVTFAYTQQSVGEPLPPAVGVDPATVQWVEAILTQAADGSSRADVLGRALASIPPLKCVNGVPTATQVPGPPLPTTQTTRPR
jgi:hypothetical protein